MDRGAWQATVHRIAKSWTHLKQLSMHTIGTYERLLGHLYFHMPNFEFLIAWWSQDKDILPIHGGYHYPERQV